MTTALSARTSRQEWRGRDVSVGEVLDQLARLRRPAEGGPPMTLAGVLNLVAYAPRPDDLAEMRRVIERLADHQPSRAVLLSEPAEGEGIDAEIATTCRHSGADRTVAVELVVLSVRGAARAGDASAALPLLRPDLPTVLWWPGPPEPGAGGPLARLVTLADRVVTEAGAGEDERGVRELARWASGARIAVTDLAWAAITPWRQLIAQMLDPGSITALRTAAAAVSIAHPAPRPTAEALLMAGWLRDVIGERLMVELHGRPGPETALLAVEIEGSIARRRLSIERIPGRGAAAVCVSAPDGTNRRRVLPLPSPDRARLLAGELELQRRDPVFERALQGAAAVAG